MRWLGVHFCMYSCFFSFRAMVSSGAFAIGLSVSKPRHRRTGERLRAEGLWWAEV
jgi:hypothetical protein